MTVFAVLLSQQFESTEHLSTGPEQAAAPAEFLGPQSRCASPDPGSRGPGRGNVGVQLELSAMSHGSEDS